jgi:serine phosphatase RsbU (regulator of sigma subunit)
VFLKSIHVNGKPAQLPKSDQALQRFERRPEKLEVVYRNNHLSFSFSAIDWSSAGRLEFSYRVKDLTDSWSEWSSNNIADFRNISPGSYTFEVRARNKFGIVSDTERFDFTVSPPWWMTWWAYVLFMLCLLGLMLAVLRWRTGRLKRRQRELETIVEERTEELKEQTQRVIEKNNEIMDSIVYAKRIQDAILPNAATVASLLPHAFIVYRPKDIVAGDFYWMKEHNGTTYFAVADCTGHGVPGALVSVVCNNALNKALEEQALEPGKILDRTREIVIDAFTKSGQDVKDGMDISLCAWNKAAGRILWAGANNPLWIIRKGELLEWKGDKQPIGKYDYAVPFTTHEIAVEKNDLLLLFSDGFQDQFGGEKKKKLKIVGWKAVLMELAEVPEESAEDFIRSWFEKWKDNEEQLDDVCLMGLRIT